MNILLRRFQLREDCVLLERGLGRGLRGSILVNLKGLRGLFLLCRLQILYGSVSLAI